MAFTGVMPAGELIAPRYGLEAGATVIRHGENDQTWGAGFQQENGLCGIRGETWVWCGTVANSTEDPPAPVDSDAQQGVTELTTGAEDDADRWEQVYPFLVQAEDTCLNTLHAKRPETKQHLLDVLEFLSIKGAERELWVGGSNQEAKALSSRRRHGRHRGCAAKAALGVVEDAMAACLPGVQGTIHIAPAVAALLDTSLQDDRRRAVHLRRVAGGRRCGLRGSVRSDAATHVRDLRHRPGGRAPRSDVDGHRRTRPDGQRRDATSSTCAPSAWSRSRSTAAATSEPRSH